MAGVGCGDGSFDLSIFGIGILVVLLGTISYLFPLMHMPNSDKTIFVRNSKEWETIEAICAIAFYLFLGMATIMSADADGGIERDDVYVPTVITCTIIPICQLGLNFFRMQASKGGDAYPWTATTWAQWIRRFLFVAMVAAMITYVAFLVVEHNIYARVLFIGSGGIMLLLQVWNHFKSYDAKDLVGENGSPPQFHFLQMMMLIASTGAFVVALAIVPDE